MSFYRKDAGRLVEQGFDPPLAYMNEMIRLAKGDGPLAGLTLSRMREVAATLRFYPGVPEVFTKLEEEVHRDYGELGIRLQEFVITGGIADLITASALGGVLDGIWGCNFAYADNEDGRVAGIRSVVSFTEKTRFLFNIEKGLVGEDFRNQPYAVNNPMDRGERPVPIKNMIYLGDGPSDIPCMSIMQLFGGYVIGILSRETAYKTWALGYGRRANVTVPPDFREGEFAWAQLRQAVIQRAEDIKRAVIGFRLSGHAPSY